MKYQLTVFINVNAKNDADADEAMESVKHILTEGLRGQAQQEEITLSGMDIEPEESSEEDE